MIIRRINILRVVACLLFGGGMALLCYGCDGKTEKKAAKDVSPGQQQVTVLASECLSNKLGTRIYSADISIYNEFTQKLNGETVYCYDFTYKIKRPDGSKIAGAFGGAAFRHRIAIVIRGKSVEAIDFKSL